ncbi:hypothetical protein ASPBRDRAFT_35710 [Aspergillus brasiliensis CBS 101740]|uniref:Uncharacterized protein n=1 Tax=Aspergillus brasiliensis (strain CBS 101740 / IMI 381727 / IBT 21946) TaxID=767769 RepID=A0A1L9U1Z6_ASPBC|nr:hypothetical protein ASPBRDRAFT_35710 [Aspergillus brasiliensis CBS 101740]
MPNHEFSFGPELRTLLFRFNVSLPVHNAEIERLRLVDAVLLRSLLEEPIRQPSDTEFVIAHGTKLTIQNLIRRLTVYEVREKLAELFTRFHLPMNADPHHFEQMNVISCWLFDSVFSGPWQELCNMRNSFPLGYIQNLSRISEVCRITMKSFRHNPS